MFSASVLAGQDERGDRVRHEQERLGAALSYHFKPLEPPCTALHLSMSSMPWWHGIPSFYQTNLDACGWWWSLLPHLQHYAHAPLHPCASSSTFLIPRTPDWKAPYGSRTHTLAHTTEQGLVSGH